MRKFLRWLKRFDTQFTLVLGLVIGGFTVFVNIRSAVRQTVLEGNYVEEVSRRVRPFMVIDAVGVIRSDHGATELIAKTQFHSHTNVAEIEMTISLKGYHETAPIVRPMTGYLYVHEVKRGTGNDWIFSLRPGAVALGSSGQTYFAAYGVDLIPEYYFMVEVLP